MSQLLLQTLTATRLDRIFHTFVEHKSSLTNPQKPNTGPYHKPEESSSDLHTLSFNSHLMYYGIYPQQLDYDPNSSTVVVYSPWFDRSKALPP
jgi:hypothetical protein